MNYPVHPVKKFPLVCRNVIFLFHLKSLRKVFTFDSSSKQAKYYTKRTKQILSIHANSQNTYSFYIIRISCRIQLLKKCDNFYENTNPNGCYSTENIPME